MDITIDGVKYVPEVEACRQCNYPMEKGIHTCEEEDAFKKNISELDKLIFDFCGKYKEEEDRHWREQCYLGVRTGLKNKIIDLAKKIVDQKAGMMHADLKEFYLEILQGLNGM